MFPADKNLDVSLGMGMTRGETQSYVGSLFNHSCDPNVEIMYMCGPKIVFFCTKPVKKDEQVRSLIT